MSQKKTRTADGAVRRIKRGRIRLISLVPAGANRVESIFKDEDGTPYEEFHAVAKMAPEGYLHTLIYIPEFPDSQGDVASAAVIKDMCHHFIPGMEGSGIDILHNCEPVSPEHAHICETFIVQQGDPRFEGVLVDGKPIDPTGSWGMVMKLDHPELQALYTDDGWRGVSMFGTALVEPLAKNEFAIALAERLGGRDKEIDMDEKTLAKLFGEALGPVVEAVADLKKSFTESKSDDEPRPVAKSDEPKIEFEGDPLSLEDVEAHEEKVFKASLDFGNPKDLKRWKDYLAKKQEAGKSDESDEGKEESEALKKARAEKEVADRKVAYLLKASNQSTEDVQTADTTEAKIKKGLEAGKASAQRFLKETGRIKG